MMNRRNFLTTGLGGLAAASLTSCRTVSESPMAGTVPDVRDEFDLVVAGGSATGVFAALRAAEAGLKVAVIEMSGGFGGTATQGLVPVWHSLRSTDGKTPIIGGLTESVLAELIRRHEAQLLEPGNPSVGAYLNVAGLEMILDELVMKSGRITPLLHTRLAAAECDRPGHVTAAIVADKSGLRRLRGRFFIDATGDADLCRFCALDVWRLPVDEIQAHSLCAIVSGADGIRERHPKFSFHEIMRPKYGAGLDFHFGWQAPVVGAKGLTFLSNTRVSKCDPSRPEDLTRAELECRAQLRRLVDAVNRAFPMPEGEELSLVALAPHVGLRESCHIRGLYHLTSEDILYGRRFDDVIARGSYRVDIHEGAGITFRYLDGHEEKQVLDEKGRIVWKKGFWREPQETMPTWYEIPYRAIVPQGAENVLAPGRMLDCAREAYGASRVMVNCNQMGESAGRAAANALKHGLAAPDAYAGFIGPTGV